MNSRMNTINPNNVDYSTFYTTAEFITNINPILFPEISDQYLITSHGRIINKYNHGHVFPNEMFKKTNRYVLVHLHCKDGTIKTYEMHRLVLGSFQYIEICQNLIVNHKDGIKWHNEWYNLEWATQKENVIHAVETNLLNNKGENAYNAALTDTQYRQICELIEQGLSPKQISEKIDYNGTSNINRIVSNIRNGRTTNSISKDYNFDKAPTDYRNKLLTNDQVEDICKYMETNGPNKMASEILLNSIGLDINSMSVEERLPYRRVISDIKRGTSYGDIRNKYKF